MLVSSANKCGRNLAQDEWVALSSSMELHSNTVPEATSRRPDTSYTPKLVMKIVLSVSSELVPPSMSLVLG